MRGRSARLFACLGFVLTLVATLRALAPEVLVAVDAIPAHLAGRFRDAQGFSQAAAGHFLVFDRRAHAVLGIDEAMSSVYTIVEIGGEPGRIIGPTAFSAAPDGSFVVADAPRGQGRVQRFSPAGQVLEQFLLPGTVQTRLLIEGFGVGGVTGLHYNGRSILIPQPESGGLVTEYLQGKPIRTFGQLRATGYESDADVHLALNSGLVLSTPDGGCLFIFQTGQPIIRKYDAQGGLAFERLLQGPEIDLMLANQPTGWARAAGDRPLVRPTVRAAAIDAKGQLWLALSVPFTYVFDADGDKVRVVQLRGAGVASPSGLTFGKNGHLLSTARLTIFDPNVVSTLPVEAAPLPPIILQRLPPQGSSTP